MPRANVPSLLPNGRDGMWRRRCGVWAGVGIMNPNGPPVTAKHDGQGSYGVAGDWGPEARTEGNGSSKDRD